MYCTCRRLPPAPNAPPTSAPGGTRATTPHTHGQTPGPQRARRPRPARRHPHRPAGRTRRPGRAPHRHRGHQRRPEGRLLRPVEHLPERLLPEEPRHRGNRRETGLPGLRLREHRPDEPDVLRSDEGHRPRPGRRVRPQRGRRRRGPVRRLPEDVRRIHQRRRQQRHLEPADRRRLPPVPGAEEEVPEPEDPAVTGRLDLLQVLLRRRRDRRRPAEVRLLLHRHVHQGEHPGVRRLRRPRHRGRDLRRLRHRLGVPGVVRRAPRQPLQRRRHRRLHRAARRVPQGARRPGRERRPALRAQRRAARRPGQDREDPDRPDRPVPGLRRRDDLRHARRLGLQRSHEPPGPALPLPRRSLRHRPAGQREVRHRLGHHGVHPG